MNSMASIYLERERERDKLIELIKDRPRYVSMEVYIIHNILKSACGKLT